MWPAESGILAYYWHSFPSWLSNPRRSLANILYFYMMLCMLEIDHCIEKSYANVFCKYWFWSIRSVTSYIWFWVIFMTHHTLPLTHIIHQTMCNICMTAILPSSYTHSIYHNCQNCIFAMKVHVLKSNYISLVPCTWLQLFFNICNVISWNYVYCMQTQLCNNISVGKCIWSDSQLQVIKGDQSRPLQVTLGDTAMPGCYICEQLVGVKHRGGIFLVQYFFWDHLICWTRWWHHSSVHVDTLRWL